MNKLLVYNYDSTQLKVTFTVEDLWSLPLRQARNPNHVSLDGLAVSVNARLKEENVSFVEPKTTQNTTDRLRMDILEHVIKARLEEVEAKNEAKEKADRKKYLESLIREKNGEAEKQKSVEELQKELADLG